MATEGVKLNGRTATEIGKETEKGQSALKTDMMTEPRWLGEMIGIDLEIGKIGKGGIG